MPAIRETQSGQNFDRRFPPAGPTIRGGFLVALLALGVALTPAVGFSQPGTQSAPQAQEPPSAGVERAVEALRANQPGADAEIIRLIGSPEHAGPTLEALAAFERLPTGMWRAVSTATTDENATPLRLAAIRLLPRFGTREAVTRLIALLGDETRDVRDAARRGLREMTGNGEDWDDDRWRSWGAEVETWSDRVWASEMITRLTARNRSLAGRQRTLGDEVVTLYRRLHVELEAAGRTTLLAELIGDDRAALRDLGFELAGRDLSARTQLGPEVAAAAAARLNHPDAGTRAKAATLVTRLVPPDAMLILTRALANERNPVAAEPMLLGVARWPNEEAVLPAIRWLERDDAPYGAVTTALWSFAQADLLAEPALRERVVSTLRDRGTARGGEPALKLLVRLGTEEDLRRVTDLLAATDDPQRNAAANALAETRRGALLLLEAAAHDPRLFPPANRAVNAHMTNPEGLRVLAGLPAIEPGTRDSAVLELAARIDPDALARAVSGAGLSPDLSARALARLTEAEVNRTPGVIDGVLMLADHWITLGRAADASGLLGTLEPDAMGESQVRRWNGLRLILAVRSGDLAGAGEIDAAPADAWLRAWRALPPDSDARISVAAMIADRFGPELSPETRAELGLPSPGAEPDGPPPEEDTSSDQPSDGTPSPENPGG